jgi:hypothetical protein
MRRTSRAGPPVSLFPFLNVLAAALGTLVLVIAGMLNLSLYDVEQAIERTPQGSSKVPVYVECRRDDILVHPDRVAIPVAEIANGQAWSLLLDAIERDRATRYLILLVRPDGLETFKLARQSAAARDLDLGYEPVHAGGPITVQGARRGT